MLPVNLLSHQVSKSKPDPHNAEYICAQLGVNCSEAIMVRPTNTTITTTMTLTAHSRTRTTTKNMILHVVVTIGEP